MSWDALLGIPLPPPKKNFLGIQDFKLGYLDLDLYPNPTPGCFYSLTYIHKEHNLASSSKTLFGWLSE
jgi:hypothetical protein